MPTYTRIHTHDTALVRSLLGADCLIVYLTTPTLDHLPTLRHQISTKTTERSTPRGSERRLRRAGKTDLSRYRPGDIHSPDTNPSSLML